jgi:hypothetical protein
LGAVSEDENQKIMESWMGTSIPQDWKERASLGGYAIPGRATIRPPHNIRVC